MTVVSSGAAQLEAYTQILSHFCYLQETSSCQA